MKDEEKKEDCFLDCGWFVAGFLWAGSAGFAGFSGTGSRGYHAPTSNCHHTTAAAHNAHAYSHFYAYN